MVHTYYDILFNPKKDKKSDYSTLKRKRSLMHATTEMDFEDIMLGEINELQKREIRHDSTYIRHLE